VVYNLTYKVDSVSALLFEEAGVQLRRYDPNKRFRVPLPLQDKKISPIKSGD
jgi:dCMP deaminase